MLSPVAFKREREKGIEGVWKTRGYSMALSGSGERTDFSLALAAIIHPLARDIEGTGLLTPIQVFDPSMKVLQLARVTVSGATARSRFYE